MKLLQELYLQNIILQLSAHILLKSHKTTYQKLLSDGSADA